MNEENKEITTIAFTIPSDLKIKEKARLVLQVRFAHPEYTQTQIAHAVGISPTRVNQILNHPRVLAVIPHVARQRIAGMVPDAVKAYHDLIKQNVNLQVKEKAASRILTEKKVLDAPTVQVVGEITLKSVSELREIVEKSVNIPLSDVIDGELVQDTPENPSPTTHPTT